VKAMYCEHCPGNGEMCDDCERDYLEALDRHRALTGELEREARRRYSTRVLGTCIGALVVIVAVAALAALVNHLTTN
jgi:hypothetical protein